MTDSTGTQASIHSSPPTTQVQPRPVKILHLITSLEVGGAQHGLLLGFPRFDLNRYEHIVCSIMGRMNMADQFRQAGIEVFSLGLKTKLDVGVAYRLNKLLRQLRPDVLHTYLLHGNVLGRVMGKLAGVPVIISSERTIGQARRWGRLATKLTNPLTDAVEVNSKTGATAAVVDLGVPENKIKLVRSGFDIALFATSEKRQMYRSDFGIADSDHLVLFVGRMRPVKGAEFGLRAFAGAIAKQPNLRMILAGEGEQQQYLQTLSADLGIDNFVKFLGIRNDLPEIMSSADSVLIPSLNEGFPRTAIEGMAAGKPVIATDVGGTAEAVEHMVTGILVQPRDVEQMTDALVKLATDPGLRSRLGTTGQDRVSQNYAVANYVNRLDGLYRELLAV